MKALIFDVTGRHPESVDLARRALRNDLKSHVCWHIFGMIMRSDRKYDEALKALKQALSLSPENPQILRDLALIQVHIRDFKGYQGTRYNILRSKLGNRQAWMGFIVAAYLAKDYETALKALSEVKKPLLQNYDANFAELFEIQQFEVRIHEESGNFEKALAATSDEECPYLDQTVLHETLGRLYMKLGRLEEATREYEYLITRNREKESYYIGLEQCKGLDKGGKEAERLQFYDEIASTDRKNLYPRIAPLRFTSGDEFQKRLISFLLYGLRTGLPSLFQVLRPLYGDPAKVKIIHNLLEVLIDRYDKDPTGVCFDGSGIPENPATIMWTFYFIAHHYDILNNFQKANEFIEKAIAHTPTVVELYLCHARIRKHAGDLIGAMNLMKRAHDFDTADRYVNCKLVKYQMRCGMFEDGIDYAGRFTKETTDPLTSLIDMQSLWIEIELAYSLLRRGRLGPALKICHEIDTQFNNFYDDQYDFHSYCLRKMTVCGYADLIKNSDVLKNHRAFIRIAVLATKIYFHLDDVKEGRVAAPEDVLGQKKKDGGDKNSKNKKPNNVPKTPEDKKNDPDAAKFKIEDKDCESFVQVDNPLVKADGFMSQLLHLDVNDIEYYQFAFRLYQRMGKFMVMTKLITQAFSHFPYHPDFYQMLNEYVYYVEQNPPEGLAKEVVDVLLNKITGGVEFAAHKVNVEKAFTFSFPMRFIEADIRVLRDPSTADTAYDDIMKYLKDPTVEQKSVNDCLWLMRHIIHGRLGKVWSVDQMKNVVSALHELHPEAVAFKPAPEPLPPQEIQK